MADVRYIMKVWFDSSDSVCCCPSFMHSGSFDDVYLGQPLWWPDTDESTRAKHIGPVFVWAVDYVSVTDERWIVFGTYPGVAEAHEGYAALLDQFTDNLRGCFVCRDWEFSHKSPKFDDDNGKETRFPRYSYTDG